MSLNSNGELTLDLLNSGVRDLIPIDSQENRAYYLTVSVQERSVVKNSQKVAIVWPENRRREVDLHSRLYL